MAEFDSKTFLVTGGGSGIGQATAARLIEAGAQVVLAGRSAERLALAAKTIDAGDRVFPVTADVTRLEDLDRLAETIEGRFGHLDGVFANAGTGLLARTADVTEEAFDQVVGTNFKGAFFTVQKALPLLTDGSAIVLNASWTIERGLALGSVYAASKAATRNLAASLAADLAGRSIRVNSVTPGHIDTDMFAAVTGGVAEVREMFRSQVVTGRVGNAAEVAEAVVFLLSQRASYITGQDLVVDGGLLGCVPFPG